MTSNAKGFLWLCIAAGVGYAIFHWSGDAEKSGSDGLSGSDDYYNEYLSKFNKLKNSRAKKAYRTMIRTTYNVGYSLNKNKENIPQDAKDRFDAQSRFLKETKPKALKK